ncbi:MAG TPA: proton-conducting transporter membrane subunit [Gemmatimonadaceae bacterium]|nr:proton-conducting transporter membrane subunit [Gemmatimonadaceae bacterium]
MIADTIARGIAVWPVAIPLLGAAITLLLRRSPFLQRGVMEASVTLMLGASVSLLVHVARGDVAIMAFGGWGAPFGITFVADRLGAALSLVTGIVALAVAIYARADVRARRRRAGFDPLFLGMLAAVNGAFLTGDLFNLYVWFELMLVAALGLISLDRRPAQIDGAIRYAAMSMVGASFILIGIGLLYGETGTLDIAHLAATLVGREPTLTLSASAFMLLAGFALKAGLFPLFFWLPASYHTAPISVTAALAGLLTKVGFYACLRVLVVVFGVGANAVVPGIPQLAALLAAVTMIVSVVAAMAQADIRRLLAFHILGQVAYLMMGLALASLAGVAAAIVYMLHTMLVQTGLFLGAGAIARAQGSYNLRDGTGLIHDRPLFTALFAVMALSLSGVPPLSGFWAKFLVIDAAFRADAAWLAGGAVIVGFLTMYSMSAVWSDAFWGTTARRARVIRPIPPAMMYAMVLLGACTIGIGLAIDVVFAFATDAASQLTQAMPIGMTR